MLFLVITNKLNATRHMHYNNTKVQRMKSDTMPRPTRNFGLKLLDFSSKSGMVGFLKNCNNEDVTDVKNAGLSWC